MSNRARRADEKVRRGVYIGTRRPAHDIEKRRPVSRAPPFLMRETFWPASGDSAPPGEQETEAEQQLEHSRGATATTTAATAAAAAVILFGRRRRIVG
jgi:hypothetical protein